MATTANRHAWTLCTIAFSGALDLYVPCTLSRWEREVERAGQFYFGEEGENMRTMLQNKNNEEDDKNVVRYQRSRSEKKETEAKVI